MNSQDEEIRTLRHEIAALKARLFVVERKLAGSERRKTSHKFEMPTPPRSLIYAAGAMVLAVLLAQAMN